RLLNNCMARKPSSQDLFQTIKKELASSDQAKPVYYLFGEEEFYLDQLLDICTHLLPEHERDFNSDLLYGQEVTPARVLSIARSFPMMAPFRVVIVRNALQLGKGANEEGGAKGSLQDFVAYFQQPNPQCKLFLFDTGKPAGNTHFGKALKSATVGFHEFKRMPDYLIPEWVANWAQQQHGKQMEGAAAQLLAQFVGNHLQLLSTEIDKVCTFVDTRSSVTQDDVKKIIGSYREYTALELKDAVLARNLDKALRISEHMLQHSKSDTGELIRLVGFFTSVFNNVWQILRLAEKGMPKTQIQQQLGISSSWYFDQLWKDASRYRYSDMPSVFEALLDADRSIKGFSTLDSTSVLFLLVQRLVG
ncbi:MAG: DNA polymerase III subunit delta, partial [Bacteroidota bacterium]